ncbi:MAG: DUF423 domain-containing protein [Chitinophagales bacterium]
MQIGRSWVHCNVRLESKSISNGFGIIPTSIYLLPMSKKLLILACILAALAVILGAFGAHGLSQILSPKQLHTYEIGIRYHFYHAFAIFMVGLLSLQFQNNVWFKRAAYCFLTGIVGFSGSLYLLSCREILGLTTYKWLGPITPIGGTFFIIAWLLLAYGVRTIRE